MKRPEYLHTTTVGETRKKYRENQRALENMLLMVSSGTLPDLGPENETYINQAMTELIIQQEYIREREKANWGWDKSLVDFSKSSEKIA